MLRLKRVEIAGFKSFYEKVDLAFPGSVTAVVGPNGCGKSNISDAVAWALGEQSAKVLRGEKMDDVIFNGSAKRRPLGMAEVVLTLAASNGDSEKGDDEGELRVGRRVYRDGEGEYFLNDKQVRLRDIQDQLLGTGLGVRAYSVIEQGRIDQVLSTKPQDRRRLIEEAAGITKYKLKKRLAETKLEETKGNLLRLSDIIGEIEKNVASLKRQASRAARYKEQTEILRQRKASLTRARGDILREALTAGEKLRDQRRDREAEAAAVLARAESALAQARLEAGEASARRDALREALASLEASIARDDALLDANQRAALDLAARRAALEREGRDFSSEQTRAARDLADLQERLERTVAEARAKSLAREEADRLASEAGAACAALERELEEMRTRALNAAGERVAARNARHEMDLAAERIAASLAPGGNRSPHRRRARLARARGERSRAGSGAPAGRGRGSDGPGDGDRRGARPALRSAHRRRSGARRGPRGGRRARAPPRGPSRDSARAGDERQRSPPGPPGRRPLGARRAVRPDPASRGLGRRRRPRARKRFGRAARLGRREARGRRDAATVVRPHGPGRLASRDAGDRPAGSFGWDAVLDGYAELSLAERAALPRTAFVDSLDDALALSETHPGMTFVTRRREVVRGPVVRVAGPSAEATGLFALRREEETLTGRLQEAREALAAAERRLEELRGRRLAREAERPPLREAEREAQGAWSAFAARVEERLGERDRLRREHETISAERAALGEEAAGLATRRRALEDEERRAGAGRGRRAPADRRAFVVTLGGARERAVARRRARPPPHRGGSGRRAPARHGGRARHAARDALDARAPARRSHRRGSADRDAAPPS